MTALARRADETGASDRFGPQANEEARRLQAQDRKDPRIAFDYEHEDFGLVEPPKLIKHISGTSNGFGRRSPRASSQPQARSSCWPWGSCWRGAATRSGTWGTPPTWPRGGWCTRPGAHQGGARYLVRAAGTRRLNREQGLVSFL